MIRLFLRGACLTLLGVVVPVHAISFLSFDARSMAMAGTGVVTARAHNASLFNPALLANARPERFSRFHVHAYAGARLLDRDNFLDSAEDFADRYEDVDLEALITEGLDLETIDYTTTDDLRTAVERVRQVQADINSLSDRPLRASASYGLSFGYSSGRWALGGYHRRFLVLGSVVRVAERDNQNIDRVVDTVESFADFLDEAFVLEQMADSRESVDPSDWLAQLRRFWGRALLLDEYMDFSAVYDDALSGNLEGRNFEDYLREPLPTEFYSTIETQGADVEEQAVSVARRFELHGGGAVQLGVTLKQVDFTTIHFEQRVEAFDLEAYRDAAVRRTTKGANADIGVMHNLTGPWQWGVVVRNVVPRTFHTVRGEEIKQRPVARLGLGFRTDPVRISLDMDLTSNEPLGFDPDKQYVSLGTEWFLWRNTALRAGLRYNAVDGETLPSVGLGIGGHHGHVDLGVARSTNGDEWGLGLQAGLAF